MIAKDHPAQSKSLRDHGTEQIFDDHEGSGTRSRTRSFVITVGQVQGRKRSGWSGVWGW
jgi:hypothetical protein